MDEDVTALAKAHNIAIGRIDQLEVSAANARGRLDAHAERLCTVEADFTKLSERVDRSIAKLVDEMVDCAGASAAHIELGSRIQRLSGRIDALVESVKARLAATEGHVRDLGAKVLSAERLLEADQAARDRHMAWHDRMEARLAALEANVTPEDPREPDGKWWVIAKKGPPTMIFHPYEGFIRWEKRTEYGWREKWRAQEVCDRLFERDEDVSVQEAMVNA